MALTRPPVVNPFANTVAPPNTPGDLCAIPTYFDSGFPAPGGVPVKPPLGFFNWLFWFATLGVRYLLAMFFGQWDSTETQYTSGSMVQDSDGRFYVCRGAATTGTHPSADAGNWFPLTMLDRVANVGSGGDWVTAISAWCNPRGARISGIDRFGVPGGRLRPIVEDWLDAAAVQISTPTFGNWFGKWKYGIFNGGGIGHVYANGPTGSLANSPWGPVCGVDFNGFTAGPAATAVESAKPWFYMSDDILEYECDISITGSALLSDTTVGVGLGDGTLVSGATRVPMGTGAAIPVGAWIYRAQSGGFWTVRTVTPGGSGGGGTITSVAANVNSPIRWKVVIVGTASSDDSTARVLHYINGALVANHAGNMNGAFLSPFQRIAGDQADISILEVGMVAMTPRLALGDQPI